MSVSSKLRSGFMHIPLIVLVLVATALIASSQIGTTKEYKNGVEPAILGEDNESEATKKAQEVSTEAEKKAEEAKKETSKSSGSSNLQVKSKSESSKDGIKIKSESEGTKSETEIETADGKKIKTKVEDDGSTKVEIEDKKLKLKYVIENGKVTLKAENESGEEVELEDEDIDELENEIEDGLEDEGIEIATGSGSPIIIKNKVGASVDFPLSINPTTNELIVTTPAGQKIVTVLPDQAIANLLSTNVISSVESDASGLTPELGSLDGIVKLEIRNDKIVYKVKGKKTHKIAGIIPVDTSTTAFVSADDGSLVAQERSLLASFVDLISL